MCVEDDVFRVAWKRGAADAPEAALASHKLRTPHCPVYTAP